MRVRIDPTGAGSTYEPGAEPGRAGAEEGYVLGLVLLVLLVVAMMSATLAMAIAVNQQHVRRDRAYTQSLAVAEAGLNQYLWMVASGASGEANNFAIPGNAGPDPNTQTITLSDPYDGSAKGTYTLEVTPPSQSDSRVAVTVTGQAASTEDAPRTVRAHVGRPAFSEYVLLVDDDVYIGGPADRVWHGKTHSNTGIRIETANITDGVSSAQAQYDTGYAGTKPGVWSQYLPSNDPSKALWHFPVPPIDFNTVTSDFARLSGLATGGANLPYVDPTAPARAHGWYIKLLPNAFYQVARVTDELESKTYSNGSRQGGYLTYDPLGAAIRYPDKGVIYANDNVWVEGTNLNGRLTIASSGQLNPPGQRDATSIHVVGDLTYSAANGTVAVGLIAQNNVEIPMYAPYMKGGPLSTMDMDIDAAMIAQQGREYVNYDTFGSSSQWGPRRDMLTIFGSVSTKGTPVRMAQSSNGSDYAGFLRGTNTYDSYLLHNPPPYFPTVGSYQILDWVELPNTQSVAP
ncbi:MAG: hypothetical protein M5U22_13755 [Thermoleophilia bacterium]|nr:hypothetical protein [Thermoleophilia bacterium]